MAKSAIQKLHADKQPQIVTDIPPGFPAAKEAPGGTMVISTPREINEIMRQVPEGRLTTLTDIRGYLARRHGTDVACPVTTAIFMNVAAQAAEEMALLGEGDITAYWRALKKDGMLNPKYPGGVEAQRAKLEAEGFTVVQRKKDYFVENYEAFLTAFE